MSNTEYCKLASGYDRGYKETLDSISITQTEKQGFWVYDKLCRYNIAMHGKTERDALLMAIGNLQKTVTRLQQENDAAQSKLDTIAALFPCDCNQ